MPVEKDDIIYLDVETGSQLEAEEISSEMKMEESIPEWEESEPEMEVGPEDLIPREKAIIPVNEPDSPKKRSSKQPKPITFSQLLLVSAVCSFAAFILALLLSLGIMGSINGGLRYASTEQVQDLARQVEALDSEISTLTQDIEGLRARLDNLDSLSGRIGELETKTEQLSLVIAGIVENYEEMVNKVAEIGEDNERFQFFLKSLGELLDTLVEQP